MPDPNRIPTWQELKKLPYLTACIEENLRITAGIPHRLARMAPKQGLTFHEWDIPAGTPVSMSIYLIHRMNPTIFPQPDEYIPERWLSPNAKSLKKYLVPFGKGPRACLGIE
jgi:cytochrome P450